MTARRMTALLVTLTLTLNGFAPAYAHQGRETESTEPVKRTTVTLSADIIPGKLTPLERQGTQMVDNGDTLQNAQGIVHTEIQSVYEDGQTLASASLAGTSFSFAPIMLDQYDALAAMPTESPSPEPSLSPEPSVSPEVSETPTASESLSPSPEVTASPDPTETDSITIDPETASPSPSPSPTETPSPTDTPASVTPEPPAAEPTLEGKLAPWLAQMAEWVLPSAAAEEGVARPSRIVGQKTSRARLSLAAARMDSAATAAAYGDITYPGLFDSVTDVRLSALTNGVKEDIIVHAYTGNHVYQYILHTEGLSATLSGQEVLLNNDMGLMLAKIEAPNMADAAGTYSTDIAVELENLGGGAYRLTYRPSDAWMAAAAYPVTIDPTGTYYNDLATGIGDTYVSSGSPDTHYAHKPASQTNYNETGNNLMVGNQGGSTYFAYIIPALTGSFDSKSSPFPSTSGLLIESATWRFNVHDGTSSSQPFNLHLVTSGWNDASITYNGRPASSADAYATTTIPSGGWQSVDVTKLFSAWFHALDQKQNYGFVLKAANGTAGDWRRLYSSDVLPRSMRMNFTATYITGITPPTLTAQPYGYGVNAESGYVDLTWTAVSGAQGYYIGIYNGTKYEYQFLGNVTSYSTKGMKLWPTQAEIAAGTKTVHWDGTGQELPNVPGVSPDLNYYFRVLPANQYGQVASSNTAGEKNVLLPDTTAPNQPTTVSVSPSGFSNADSMTATWAGMTDLPTLATTLGTGKAQYCIDPDITVDPAAWTWTDTASNQANGSAAFPTTGLSDGTHAVYIRGVDSNGNYGAPKGAEFKVDKTAPTAPVLTLLPATWTKDASASLTWAAIADLNDLARVEIALDSGSYVSTGLADKDYAGYTLDISALADGEHTVSVRGVDVACNNGTAATAAVKIDRSAPTVDTSSLDPAGWADTGSVKLQWTGAKDAFSGLSAMLCSVDGGSDVSIPASVDGSASIDVSALADGQHTVTLKLSDALGNEKTVDHTLYLDRTAPEAGIIAPQNGDVVTGVLEIWGSVKDVSLKDWTLTATGSSGKTVTVQAGTAEKDAAQLGVLNTEAFADGETIEVTLTAHDEAGHETVVRGVYIKADHSAKPIAAEVTLTAPAQGETVTTAYKQATYTLGYAGSEADNRYSIDGTPTGIASGLAFPLYPILYPEGSVHGLSVISQGTDDKLHYSQGMATTLVISDILKDDSKLLSHSGVDLTPQGAVLTAASGEITSVAFTSSRPMLALRLHTVEQLASGGSIGYEYSVDGGVTWRSIRSGYDVFFDTPQTGVSIRAALTGAGTVLQGLDVTGVYEMSPVRFKVQLLRPVTPFAITNGGLSTKALPAITTDSTAPFTTKRLYVDGVWNADSFTADFLPCAEGTTHTVTAIGIDAAGSLHGSGAAASILLRNTPGATGTYETGKLTLSGSTFAIRAETLCTDGAGKVVTSGAYAYSTDGTTWTDFTLGSYALLSRATQTLYLRATLPAGVTLAALHLEGVTATGKTITTTLVKPVTNAQAADYGDYYENEKLRRYVLTWTDPNRDDETCGNTLYYDIYRNGTFVKTVQTTRYEDFDYVAGATYQIAARRVYAAPADGLPHILTRVSDKVTAAAVHIPAKQIVEGVQHSVSDFTQSEYLNDLYGGHYTFSDAANPPAESFALNQSLLGPHRFCSLGFEPVNFNTGNFFLQTQDYAQGDLGSSGLDVTRTYNTQSTELDGPFGGRWGTVYAQHLRLYGDGSVAYRRADGSEVIFYRQADGRFFSNTTEYETLTFNDAKTEYRVTLTDGTVYVFASGGLLRRVETDGGLHATEIVRDENGLITRIVSPSQEELLVEMDANGHIVKLTTPGGAVLTYQYRGNHLVAYTDAEGYTTKYQYDSQGRMTAWLDGNGRRQVLNKYDAQSRVVYQEDGNRGKYRLTYESGRTVTTDAEGNVVTYYYDSLKRATKIVDALGGVTAYTYGENGEILSMTDPMGGITAYAYNAAGDKVSEVAPNGTSVAMTYDGSHHLLTRQDQNGAVTHYEYDTNGNLIQVTAPDGGMTIYAYDIKGRIMVKTDALGGRTTYEYINGLLTQTADPYGAETRYSYDANGYLASATDALGNTTLYTHDAKGNLLSLTFTDGSTVSYDYDALGRQTAMTDALGNVTRYQYDALGNRVATILPDKTKQTAAYTPNNQLKTQKDALGNVTTFTYDANGNKLTETDPAGNTTTYAYDLSGHVVRETNPAGGVTTYTYDAVGLPLTVTDPTGATQTMTYDAAGNLLTRTLPNGAVIRTEYDSQSRPVKQVNALGGETLLTYDPLNHITSLTDPLGAKTTYTYDAIGNLLTVTDAAGGVTRYDYDALSRVVSETGPLGGVTTYAYDSVGNLVSSTDALGNQTAYAYDANGNLLSMTDALGQTVSLAYDKSGNATRAIQKNGGVLATSYDKAGRVIAETDANKNTTKYAYSKNGLVTQVTDALGQKASFAYDALGNITKITAPGKAVTLYEYDAAGRALSTTDAVGCVTAYTYNEAGQIGSQTVNGNATGYEYDLAGNIIAITDAEGRQVRFTYDVSGNLLETLYPDGTKDVSEYGALGRLVKATPRNGLSTAYTYDAAGNLLSETTGEQTTRYAYDLLGRLIQTAYADGSAQTYAYDALGNVTGQTDALGNATAYAYTAESLLSMVTDANGNARSLSYDLAGNVTAETDAEGNTKQYLYDQVNRLAGVIDEMGGKTSYAYDALDNIAKVIDAMKRATRYTYDLNGNLTSETDALGNTVKYAYTPEGWLSGITKADGTVQKFTYDKTGNLLVQDVGEGQTISSAYNDIGKVTRVSSPEGTISYQYNDKGYLVSVENASGDVVRYTYDAYGNKASMTYPDGRTVSYEYDARNRMVSAIGLDGSKTAYCYDKAGRRVSTASSTLTTTYTYDSVGNLLAQATSGASSIAFSYSYNKNNYITQEARTEAGKTTTSAYSYDPLGEVTSFLQSTGYGERYTYDKVGNMLQKAITGTDGAQTALKMSYNKGNQLTKMASGKDAIAYSYDANGSLLKKVLSSKQYGKLTDTYSYNALDQLAGYTGYDGYRQQFTYDANGMRLSKRETGNGERSTLEELLRGEIAGLPQIVEPTISDDGAVPPELQWATTEYLYDITQEYYQVIEEKATQGGHEYTTAYDYGLERIAAYNNEATTQYLYDGRGSVAQSVTAYPAGQTTLDMLPDVAVGIQSFAYTAFGEQMGDVKVSGFGYNAEAFDAATGNVNLRARQYEPTMGRFAQKDIIRGSQDIALSMARFLYTYNNPIQFSDPTGWISSSLARDKKGNIIYGKDGDPEISIHFDPVKKKTAPVYNIDLTARLNMSKDNKMPLTYSKAVVAALKQNRTLYAADRIPKVTSAGATFSECVGVVGRFAAITWFEKAYAKTIATTVESTYRHSTRKSLVSADMIKYDGMAMVTGSYSHIAVYYETFFDGTKVWHDVIVDIRGQEYKEGMSDAKKREVDRNNTGSKAEISITQFEEGYSDYSYACDLYYIDYEN